MNKLTLEDVPIENKTILLRTDFNVPLSKNYKISDDFRIKSSLPTIKYLLKNNCKVVIISHLGRPNGFEKKYSLEKVGNRLATLLKRKIYFVDDCIGDKVRQVVKKTPKKSVILLENLRFYKEEEQNDNKFASNLASSSMARYFVQDGFGVVHRKHASTDAITDYLPSVAGKLLVREYNEIIGNIKNPTRPLYVILGGAKVSDKIQIVEKFIKIADKIIIGGAMANTFLKYMNKDIGDSVFEKGQKKFVDNIMQLALKNSKSKEDNFILLPIDVAVSQKFENGNRINILLNQIGSKDKILDIGDQSAKQIISELKLANTVIWNGPLGVTEFSKFSKSSIEVAKFLSNNKKIKSIIGGGDTADFLLKWDKEKSKNFTHISTGGGASIELMAGKKLPGIKCLLDSK